MEKTRNDWGTILVRLPLAIKKEIVAQAVEENRSIGAHALHLLKYALASRKNPRRDHETKIQNRVRD